MNKLRLTNKEDAKRIQEFEGSEALGAAREVAAASKLTVEKIMNLDGKDFPAYAGMLDRAEDVAGVQSAITSYGNGDRRSVR